MNGLERENRVAICVLRLIALGCAVYVTVLLWGLVVVAGGWEPGWMTGDFERFIEGAGGRLILPVSAYGMGLWLLSIYLRIKGW